MAFPPRLNPDDWRTCRECDRSVRARALSDMRVARAHLGHHFTPFRGFHLSEWFRYLLGWL